jgi:glucose/arabinose dehydrogenase
VNDEMNAVERGKNYGWPLVQGYCDHFPTHEPCGEPLANVDPAFEFRQVIGAAGIAIYEAELFTDLDQDILLAGYHSKRVHRLHFSAERGRFVELAPVFELDTSAPGYFGGGMVDVRVAPDGSILALASGLEVGTIFRLTPAAAPAALEGPWAPRPPAPSVRASGGCHASAAPIGSASPGWVAAALLALARARRPSRRRPDSSGS